MKKITLKNLGSQPTPFFKKTHLFNFNKIALLFVFIFYTMLLSAQQGRTIPTTQNQYSNISHIDSFLANQRTSVSSKSATVTTPLRIETLINDLQPSIYLLNGTEKTYGENPVCLFTNVQSLNAFKNSKLPSNVIEIITIKITSEADLNLAIDLALFSEFSKLQYIYILSEIKISEDQIIKIIKNNNPKLNILFNAVKAS